MGQLREGRHLQLSRLRQVDVRLRRRHRLHRSPRRRPVELGIAGDRVLHLLRGPYREPGELTTLISTSTAVDYMAHDPEVFGSTPAKRLPFFYRRC